MGVIIGLIIGTFIGMFIMCCLVVANDDKKIHKRK